MREKRSRFHIAESCLHRKSSVLPLFPATGAQAIQRYEYGERKPAYDVLIALADFFDVSIDYLVGRTDNPAVSR